MSSTVLALFALEWRRWCRQPLPVLVLALQYTGFALALWHLTGQHLALQAVQVRNLSLSDDVLTPMYGVIAALIVGLAPLLAMAGPALARSQQIWHWQQQGSAKWALLLSRALVGLVWQALFILPAFLSLLALRSASPIALGQMAVALAGCLLVLAAVQAILLVLALLSRNGWLAAMLGCIVLSAWAGLDLLQQGLGLFGQFHAWRDGLMDLGSALYFLAITLAALTLAHRLAWPTAADKKAKTLRFGLSAIALGLLSVGALTSFQYDAGLRTGQIPEALIQWLTTTAKPANLSIVSVDANRGQSYAFALRALSQAQPTISIELRPHGALPPALREQLPDSDGLLIESAGRQDWLNLPLDDLAATAIIRLQHLQQLSEQWLVFVQGHGERRLLGDDTRDLNQLGENLRSLGYTVAPLSPPATAIIPDNTQVLVLAHVASELLPAEMTAVLAYVKAGGHLLWLRDPDDAPLPELEQVLGVRKRAGTVFDYAGVKRGTPHPAIAVVDSFGQAAATKHLNTLVALPWAAALAIQQTPSTVFTTEILLQSAADAVLTDTPDDLNPPVGGAKGPFILGVALERPLSHCAQNAPACQQRIIVLGDSNFASDTAIKNYGNQALALALLRWLALADAAPALPEMQAEDAVLLPASWHLWALRLGSPLGLALLVLLPLTVSVLRWRRR